MAFDTPRSSELTGDQLTLQNKLELDDGSLLYYDNLPLKKRSRKACSGFMNGVPCTIKEVERKNIAVRMEYYGVSVNQGNTDSHRNVYVYRGIKEKPIEFEDVTDDIPFT